MNSILGPIDAALLSAAIVLAAPVLLAATGELVSQRAGVFNVGLEGMMLVGAFCGFLFAWHTGSMALGVAGGVGGGCLLAAVMGLLAIEAKADQIVAGIGVNLLAVGLTSFFFDSIFASRDQVTIDRIDRLSIPGLSSVPWIGKILFNQNPLTYVALALVPLTWFILYRTHWGLSIRAVGESPAAADTSGINVRLVRWASVMTAGALAGLGGAILSLAQVGLFRQEMTAGRGFIALVVVIFGRWNPIGVLGACLVVGLADALQLRLQGADRVPPAVWLLLVMAATAWAFAAHQRAHGDPRLVVRPAAVAAGIAAVGVVLLFVDPSFTLPSELWRAMPYLISLVLLTGLAGQRLPSALTIPYRRGTS